MNNKKKIILSSFACDPTKGSEFSTGWNWATGLSLRGFEVHCFTRKIGKSNIESTSIPNNLKFHYITLPFGLERLYSFSTAGMYLYYLIWQWVAFKSAKRLHKALDFDLVHHVSWGSTQMGSFMDKLKIPLIFGPAGGGQVAPWAFRSYFLNHWKAEENRAKIANLLLKFSPTCARMLRNAHAVIVSNPETEDMVRSLGVTKVYKVLDSALPSTFFPAKVSYKVIRNKKLKLLWTGRFLPRKGLLLILDVMKELKSYPNISLTVVGDGEMKIPFLEKLKENQLQDTVIWKGSVPYKEIRGYYESHDVFFFTSLRDSCPAQLIEAMAYGMPVVTLDLHGQAVIINEDIGFKCECTNPADSILALKNAIVSLYEQDTLITEKSKNSYAFAKLQTWDLKIDNIINTHYPKYE